MKIREQVKQNICIKMHSNMYLIPNQASVLPSSENRLTVNLGREVKHWTNLFPLEQPQENVWGS